MFGIAEGIFFDAAHPMEDGYFGEITFTEIGQEIILFVLFAFYLIIGYRWREIQPVSNLVSLFFLMSFIREFNFLVDKWIFPVLIVFAFFVWLFVRDFKKNKGAAHRVFRSSGLIVVFFRISHNLFFQPFIGGVEILATFIQR